MVKNKDNIGAILRVFCTLFGELSAALLISVPTSRTLLILTIRLILFIISLYITFLLEKKTYVKSK